MVERENRYHREVWVVPTAGGPAMRFTSPGTESSNPRFSPDGKYLFFTSNRPGGQGGSWALRMDEPGGEATQISWAPPASASWSRDGKLAVWADADSAGGTRSAGARPDSADPFARTPMARAPYGAVTRPIDPRRFDGRHVVDFPYKSNDRGYVPNRRDARRWTPSQLWTLAAGDTVKKRITDTRYSHQGAALSPDGKWIAFVADSALRPDSIVEAERDSLARLPYDAKRDEADRNTSDIYVVPATGGAPRKVATIAGTEGSIAWSPDGKQIAYVWRPARVKSARLAAVDVATGRARNLLGDWKYEPNGFEWLPNGDLMMSASVGGRGALFRVSPASGAVTEVLGGRRRMNGFAYDAAMRTVAYVASSVTQPTELYVAGVDGKGERKLTAFNEKLTREVAFSDAERFTYQSVGGLEVEGWLMKPYGYEAGKKYPLVLYIHGGPHSAYDEGWFDEFQNLAATGMFVLYTNPRGSSGYGADFTYSTRGRWGAEDYEDLMKAVDIAARRPDVDSTKMGVTGGSYGGFMTAWITTKTNRFKAASRRRRPTA
jgi:dipeptidyl aminopeptidase/acylaminoacyl peptidase